MTARRPEPSGSTPVASQQPDVNSQIVTPQPTETPPTAWANNQAATPTPTPGPQKQTNQWGVQSMSAQAIPADSDCSDGECVFWVSASADDAGPDLACIYATNRNEVYFGKCNGDQDIISGFRFPNVSFPQGEKVTQAYIEFTVDGPYTEELTQEIYGEATGNAAVFSSTSRPDNRSVTQAFTSWDVASTDQWILDQTRNSPDLTSIVQEIVDRSDWQAGNAMAIIVKNAGPAGAPNYARRVIGYDRWGMGPGNAARLVIKGGPEIPDPGVTNPCPPGGTDECYELSASGANGYGGDPINTRTGILSYQTDDIAIPTSAGQLGFQRTYSSLATDLYADTLGYGWTHSLDTRLILPDDPQGVEGFILLKLHSANHYEFIDNGDDTYTPGHGVTGSLTYDDEEYTFTLPDQSTYTFDDEGIIQTRTDSEGRLWEYTYTSGRLTQVSADGGDRYLELTYDGQGRIETVADHTERSVTFGYDEAGDLVSAMDVSGGEWQYEYDSAHHLTEVINPLEQTVERTEYDLQGRAVRQWDGLENQTIEITYNQDGTNTIEDALGNTTIHAYDSRNTLTENTDALDATESKMYNNNFRPVRITDPLDQQINMTWSADGVNLTQLVDENGGQTDITYDEFNQPISVIDPMSSPTSYEYDGTRLTGVTDALEGETTYTYTVDGYLESATDPLERTTTYTYDEYGQRISMTDPLDQTWSYTYDDLGRLIDTTDPLGHVTHNVYDDAGRLLSITRNYDTNRDPNEDNQYNLVTAYQYDLTGNQIAVTDTYGVVTRTYFDAANRPVTVVQNLNGQSIETTTPPERGSAAMDENLRTDMIYDDAGNVIASIDPNGVIGRTYYDEANRPVTVVQNLTGQSIETTTPPTYDPEYPDSNVRTDTTYDASGNVIATTDTNGVITRTYFDAANRSVTVVQNLTGQSIETASPPARGSSLSLANIRTDTTYDVNGNVIATTDPLGVITRTYYDALNRPITLVQNLTGQAASVEEPPEGEFGDENVRTDTYYNSASQAIATVDPMGVITRTYYDDSSRPVTVVRNLVGQDIYVETPPLRGSGDPDENVRTDTTYDELGRRSTSIDALGQVTLYEYNDGGQLQTVTENYSEGQAQNYLNEYNLVTEYSYDALGRQLTVTDTLGRVTATIYDELGRTSAQTINAVEDSPYDEDQYNITTSFAYDLSGAQIAVTDPLDMVTRTYYDALGRSVSAVRNLSGQGVEVGTPPVRGNETNLRVDTVYDGAGRAKDRTDELGNTSSFDYDPLGRQTSVTDPLEHDSQSTYDVAGRLIDATDADGMVTHFGYDALSRLTDVWENYQSGQGQNGDTNVHTVYAYDANGNRGSIQDGNGHVTTFTYDDLGRLESETDPLEHTWVYTYDAAGNRVSMADPNEATIGYGYDSLNRLLSIDYPSPDTDVTFTYDAVGRRLTMVDGLGTTTWTYDALDRPLTTTDPFDNTVTYTYNALGNRVTLTYPDEKVVSYAYDSAHRLDEISLDASLVAGYAYDANGRVTGITRANGVDTTYTYDDADRLTQLQHVAGENELASYEYTYDDLGNRTQAVENYREPNSGSLLGDGFRERRSLRLEHRSHGRWEPERECDCGSGRGVWPGGNRRRPDCRLRAGRESGRGVGLCRAFLFRSELDFHPRRSGSGLVFGHG